MSILESLYNMVFTVKRLQDVEDSRIDTQITISSGNEGVIMEPSNTAKKAEVFTQIDWGKAKELYCGSGVSLKEGDTIEDTTNSQTYTLQTVAEHTDLEDGNESHKVAILYKDKA